MFSYTLLCFFPCLVICLADFASANPRVADQMCRWDSLPHISPEEQLAAEESLSAYCKPVELYNVLRRRAIDRPTFLQRCLRYKKQEKNKRRIQMAISLTGNIVCELHTQSLFPMYVLLARPVQVADMQNSEVYNYSRIGVLTCSTGTEGLYPSQVNFMLPEMDKLAAVIEDNYFTVLLVSCAENYGVMSGNDLPKNHRNMTSFPSNIGGSVLIGEIPLARMFNSWKESRRSNERERAVMYTTVDMNPRVLKPSALDVKKCLCFQIPSSNSGDFSLPLQVPVSGSAEEVWAKEKNVCNVYHNGGATSSLSDLSRLLRNGNVNFYYRFFNNKYYIMEVTEDFSCPFCLVKGASYEGLRNHLLASHDLFNFEFMVTDEVQAVHVFVNSDQWSSEIQDGVDPKRAAFKYCNRPFRRLLSAGLGQGARHVTPLALESSDLQVATNEAQCRVNGGMDYFEHITSSLNAAGCSSATTHSSAEFECAQSAPGNKSVPPPLLQFAKSRKLSAERSDPRKSLLQKRQFFHSHRAQPMALEQVLSDRDSEDEVDDDVADFEDRRMLDDFVDVTKDEKQMMHLWNSFVRRHGVLADGHIPWACEAFTRSHGQALTLAPALLWCWRLFMVKLWNHGLLDARTMDDCNKHLEQYQVKERDPSK